LIVAFAWKAKGWHRVGAVRAVDNDLLELSVYSIVMNIPDCVIEPSHSSHSVDMRKAQAFLAVLNRNRH